MSFGSRTSREDGEIPSFEEDQYEDHSEQPQEEFGTLVKFFWAKSNRGKDILQKNGFEYAFDKHNPHCPGRIIVKAKWYEEVGKKFKIGRIINDQHNHAAIDPSVRDAKNTLRNMAVSENPQKTRRAVDIARHQIPSREQAGDYLLDASTISIPDNLKEKVVFFDMVEHDTMLVFCSSFGKQILVDYGKNICIDGTFKCRPLAFTQLYTINVLIDRTAVPAVYALMGNKKQLSYEKLFTAIKNEVPDWDPSLFFTDYEIAAMQAVQHVFPASQIAGCLFHFAQCLFRKLQTLPQLFADFRNNEANKCLFKCFISLAFVPPEHVYEYFCILVQNFPRHREMESNDKILRSGIPS
uniref:MULE transposase domain-containing protein n=1 Tax=Meloidogyne javanica TaxID=6303 RepID=A0A915N3X4_MELJA